ncbi:MAG: hypothetical protein U1E26_10030 [Coriobacteriia bacterium]|nr:hypothetical protein [Coriobacteriia bacterium]
MSLRQALAILADDRDTALAARDVISFFDRHRDEVVPAPAVGRATGLSASSVAPLLTAFAQARVIDCDGDPCLDGCRYHPDQVLDLEVRRFLRDATRIDGALRRRVDRFRGSYGPGR